MANSNLTPSAAHLEEALTVLFCLIDEAYDLLNPSGSDAYSSLKRLSDSEVLTLALFQQLRGLESERSFLPQGRGEILLAPVPWRSGIASVLLAPEGTQAQALDLGATA